MRDLPTLAGACTKARKKFQGIVLRHTYMTKHAASGMMKLGLTEVKDSMISKAKAPELAPSSLDNSGLEDEMTR